MRKLFIPFAKLLGIYLIYRSLNYLVTILYYLFSNILTEQDAVRTGFLYTSIAQILFLILALILLFKTEKIADILRLPNDDINLGGIDHYSILHAGLILIGVVMIIYAIPTFIGSLLTFVKYRDVTPTTLHYQELQRMVSSLLKAVLGFILVFRAVQIAKHFDKQT